MIEAAKQLFAKTAEEMRAQMPDASPVAIASAIAIKAIAELAEAGPAIAQEIQSDAARYRWWVDPAHDIPSSVFYSGKAVVDAYIDGELAIANRKHGETAR